MRLLRLTLGDLRFQWRHGFYGLYAVFAAVYVLALSAVPGGARQTVAAVLIFTDPAAMGLFFMGAIVLLEKSQRVNCALAVSPARVWEYCAAKLLSLAFIGLIVALILALAGGVKNVASCLAGVFLSSVLCSACGMAAAMRSKTLNQFVLLAVPFELVICLPPVLLLFNIEHPAMLIHPGVAAIYLIYGEGPGAALCLLSLALWCVPALLLCVSSARRGFLEMGGAGI